MRKKGEEKSVWDFPKILLYTLEIIVLCLLISYLYFSIKGNDDYSGFYGENAQKNLIETLFTSLKLETVHSIPYIGTTPKIQIYIEEDKHFVSKYYLEIIKGNVTINSGVTSGSDIIIRTTREEIIKIMENKEYIKESLVSGNTTIEKTTSDFILFSKGYPELFTR
jgi:hypothetical protein